MNASNIIKEKNAQRKIIKEKTDSLTEAYCKNSDEGIYENIISLNDFQRATFIFCFASVEKEINTYSIIRHAWRKGKRVAVPKCIGRGIMEIYEIHSFDDLEPGAYNIPEPKKGCKLIAPSQIDFSIIPCLSCDREGRRLGHGGGYYDRYLEDTDFVTAAICRDMLLLDKVQAEPHDRNVDYVITENHIIGTRVSL
ncbi:MAG: 5-formyltetrahydrofolate cyclo-ligase [Clostridiales bacterium]|nr:5-formyltetrahydrofolate cyclo-ligase [Clostridiales bacterium]